MGPSSLHSQVARSRLYSLNSTKLFAPPWTYMTSPAGRARRFRAYGVGLRGGAAWMLPLAPQLLA